MILNLNKLVKYAEENSNRETDRKFSVDEMVRRWRKTMADVDEGSPKIVQSI